MYSEDQQLVRRLLAGDEPSFTAFFDDNYARLYRFAMARLSGDRNAAEEIAQATLSRALQKLETYRGESQLFTWLCAICRREIAELHRQTARREKRVVLIEDHPDIRGAVESLAVSDDMTPDRGAEREERLRLIQVALDQLPPRYGDALEWKYIEGHSTAEVAARLEIGREAAQSLLARAKRAFADVYSTLVESPVRT